MMSSGWRGYATYKEIEEQEYKSPSCVMNELTRCHQIEDDQYPVDVTLRCILSAKNGKSNE